MLDADVARRFRLRLGPSKRLTMRPRGYQPSPHVILRITAQPSDFSRNLSPHLPVTSGRRSVLGRTLDVIDHEDIDRTARRFQFQSELFLKGREDGKTVRIE